MAINLAEIKPAVLKAKDVATVNDIEIAEANFNAAIATTNSYVTTINNTLSDIASDAKLTAGEKQAVKREWETIVAEKPSLVNQATSFVVTSAAYIDKYNALDSYLNTPIGSALLTSLVTTSDIVSSTFTTKFKEYYTAKIDLLNALAAKAKEIADSKVNSTYVTTAIANSGYVLPADVAAAINNNTTTIEGSKITTGSISANKINTTDLIVQSVKPLTGGGFEIDANGTAGELGNAHIYGARIYGTKLDGATITGSIIEASYMQNAIAFDTYTTYTSCPGFPNGIPILSSFTSVGTVTNSRPSYWSASSGDSFTITGTSDTFPYYGCLQNVKKLKTATTATTLALGGAPIIRSGFNIPTIVIPGFTNSVSLFTFNGVSAPPGGTLLGLSSVAPVNILGSLSMTISYRGNTYTKSLADFTSPLTSGYSFTGESSFAYIDYKTLQLTTNLYLYVKWQNAGGSLDSVGGGMLGGKQCSIGICTTSTPVHTSDTGISTVDLLSYSITGTVGTKPASYYGNYYVSITPQIPQISVVN